MTMMMMHTNASNAIMIWYGATTNTTANKIDLSSVLFICLRSLLGMTFFLNVLATERRGAELPTPRQILYPREKVRIGWKNSERKWIPGAGMINVGNTCYLNSTLQALFHVPAFANWLISDYVHRETCEEKCKRFVFFFLSLFLSLFSVFNSSSKIKLII